MQAVFYGVGASVIGIITISAYKLTLKTIGQSRLLWFLFLCSAVVTIITESESIWLFLGAGMLAWVLRTTPWKKASSTTTAFEPFALLAAAPAAKASFQELLTQIALFFTKAGAFVFGSGLAKGLTPACQFAKNRPPASHCSLTLGKICFAKTWFHAMPINTWSCILASRQA